MTVDRAEFLDLIEAELAELRGGRERDGWSKWVLIAGTATIGWLLLGQIDHSINPTQVTLCLVAGSLFLDAIGTVTRIGSPYPGEVRFFPAHQIFRSPAELVAHVIRALVLALCCWAFLDGPKAIGLALFYLVTALAFCVGFVFVKSRDLFPSVTARGYELAVAAGIGVGVPVLLLAWVTRDLEFTGAARTAAVDLRVAALLLAGNYVLMRLLKESQHSHVESGLLQTRRQIVLGQLEVEEGATAFEKILVGVGPNKLGRALADEVFERMASVVSDCIVLRNRSDAASERADRSERPTDKEWIQEEWVELSGMMSSVGRDLEWVRTQVGTSFLPYMAWLISSGAETERSPVAIGRQASALDQKMRWEANAARRSFIRAHTSLLNAQHRGV